MTTKMIMTDAAPSFTHFQTSMTHCGKFACGYHRRLGRDRSGSIVTIVPHSRYDLAVIMKLTTLLTPRDLGSTRFIASSF